MATKIRKQIYIDAEQEAILKQIAADTGMSEAEIIRKAVSRYSLAMPPSRRNLKAWEEEKAFIQQLIESIIDFILDFCSLPTDSKTQAT